MKYALYAGAGIIGGVVSVVVVANVYAYWISWKAATQVLPINNLISVAPGTNSLSPAIAHGSEGGAVSSVNRNTKKSRIGGNIMNPRSTRKVAPL
jgi:hypothetical protein